MAMNIALPKLDSNPIMTPLAVDELMMPALALSGEVGDW